MAVFANRANDVTESVNNLDGIKQYDHYILIETNRLQRSRLRNGYFINENSLKAPGEVLQTIERE